MSRKPRAEGKLSTRWYLAKGRPETLPAYRNIIVLRGRNGEIDLFARNSKGLHVPVTQLDPRDAARLLS